MQYVGLDVRIRRFLKRALRAYGLRCTRISAGATHDCRAGKTDGRPALENGTEVRE
jgi:hypothetical protein